jgi:hypothetical protein
VVIPVADWRDALAQSQAQYDADRLLIRLRLRQSLHTLAKLVDADEFTMTRVAPDVPCDLDRLLQVFAALNFLEPR